MEQRPFRVKRDQAVLKTPEEVQGFSEYGVQGRHEEVRLAVAGQQVLQGREKPIVDPELEGRRGP